MLVAIALGMFLAFGGMHSSALSKQLEQTAKLIKKDVADEGRRKQALAIVERMKDTETASLKERNKMIETLHDVIADHHSTVEQIRAANQPIANDDAATAKQLLDLRFELKKVLTADEWKQIFPPPAEGNEFQSIKIGNLEPRIDADERRSGNKLN